MTQPTDPLPWKVLDSTYLTRRPWLTLRQDQVRLPNGAVIDDFFVLEYPAWVTVVAVTADDRIVLVRQYRHGLGRVDWELPAGVVEAADGSPEAAARRELLEETGYGGGVWSPLMVASANAGTHNNLTHSFLAVGVAPVAADVPEPTEDLRCVPVPPAAVARLVDAGGIVQALHLAPLLLYLLRRPTRE